jgi:arsenite oxidase large subunit
LIFAKIANRLAHNYGEVNKDEWQYYNWEQIWSGMQKTKEGEGLGINLISPELLASLGTNGVQLPVKKVGGQLVGELRAYEGGKFATPDGKGVFTPYDQFWTEGDPLAFLPEEIKPNAEYPYFVTTVRYQTIWQSGYTYRWTHALANASVPYMEFVVNPVDAKRHGITDGDWAELSNQYSATHGVVNVSPQVPPGLISAIFGWAGPHDENPNGNPQFYANNLVAGGADVQQKSNGAFFKNTRAALRKLDQPPITATTAPGLSEKNRYGHVSSLGVDGNPKSNAKNFIAVSSIPRKTPKRPKEE